ncbi:glycine oxidase ThiO [Pelagibacterium halotolerans]|uniref:glycine oxidase ThiO n=1 Tax=Pelagibacterium halotolerans TaxID=531813 RepID=UPI00384D4B4C
MRVTVIGAGVAGLAVAAELMARQIAVEVIERGPAPGPQSCSWYAGGMLAPWCEGETAEEPVVRLGQQAADWWQAQGVEVTRRGTLVVAPSRDGGELARFARRTEQHQWLERDALGALEPELAAQFAKALYFPREAHIDPRQALAVLAHKLEAGGVTIRYGSEQAPQAQDSTVIDARGFGARDELPDLRGVKGEMLVLKTRDIAISRPVRLLHPRVPAYLVPRGNGVYMLGATQIESEDRRRITARGMVDLLNAAYAVHPAFAEAEIIETGADVRPAFPDNLPRLRWRGGTLHVNGLFRHGFLLAPACARLAAEAIANPDNIPEMMDEDRGEWRTA